MKLQTRAVIRCASLHLSMLAGALAVMISAPCLRAQAADQKPAEPKASAAPEVYQTFYLSNPTQQSDVNEITTDLRNLVPKAKIYVVGSQGAISIRCSAEDLALAQKIITDLDRSKKVYRITYTITESESGKRISSQRLSLIVVPGNKTILKQGSRVPVVTGTYEAAGSTPNSQVQYIDLGLNIEASLDGFADGLRLRTKVEQSGVADEKSGMGTQDPVIRQTMLEGMTILVQGKPLVLGSLDVPGTTRHQEIEVTSEVIR
jgi:type II secretory pathway component GspD/PulD (secretin)